MLLPALLAAIDSLQLTTGHSLLVPLSPPRHLPPVNSAPPHNHLPSRFLRLLVYSLLRPWASPVSAFGSPPRPPVLSPPISPHFDLCSRKLYLNGHLAPHFYSTLPLPFFLSESSLSGTSFAFFYQPISSPSQMLFGWAGGSFLFFTPDVPSLSDETFP